MHIQRLTFSWDVLLYCCCLIKYDILSITIKCVNGDFMYDNKVNYEYITFFCFILMAYARKSDRDLTWFNWNHMEGQLQLLQCSAKVFGPLKKFDMDKIKKMYPDVNNSIFREGYIF